MPLFRGIRGKALLLLSAALILLLLLTTAASVWQTQRIVIAQEQQKLVLLKQQIEQELRSHRKNLLTLHGVPPIMAIVRARSNSGIDPQSGDPLHEWQQRLSVIFKAMLSNHQHYFQIRYFDAAGSELVRVEQGSNSTLKVSIPDTFISYASESYIREAVRLKAGEVYQSDVEQILVEDVQGQPLRLPVLRLATPVYDGDRVVGVLLLKLFADQLFSDLHNQIDGVRYALADQRGIYLKHSVADYIFSDSMRLQQRHPEFSTVLERKESYFHFHPETFELDGYQKISYAPERYWLIIMHMPRPQVLDTFMPMLMRMLLISVFIGALLVFSVSWIVSRQVVTPLLNLVDIAGRLKRGDLEVEIDASEVRDEMQVLYGAIGDYAENQRFVTRQLKDEVLMQTRRLAAVVDHTVDAIITISERGVVESFNQAACKMFGYSEDEVIGKNVSMLMPEPDRSAHDGYLDHYMQSGERRIIGIGREVSGLRKDGSQFPIDLSVSELPFVDGRHFIGVIRDISERKAQEEAIRHLAHHDMLTGLPNRVLFHDRMEQAIKQAHRKSGSFALLFIDLDGFKAVNDRLGHEAGDKLLQQVAERLNECVREVDSVARLGGDEFAVILDEISESFAREKADHIIAAIAHAYPDLGTCEIGCSIGIALYPQHGSNVDQLLSSADAAMYQVKRSGKNSYAICSGSDNSA